MTPVDKLINIVHRTRVMPADHHTIRHTKNKPKPQRKTTRTALCSLHIFVAEGGKEVCLIILRLVIMGISKSAHRSLISKSNSGERGSENVPRLLVCCYQIDRWKLFFNPTNGRWTLATFGHSEPIRAVPLLADIGDIVLRVPVLHIG